MMPKKESGPIKTNVKAFQEVHSFLDSIFQCGDIPVLDKKVLDLQIYWRDYISSLSEDKNVRGLINKEFIDLNYSAIFEKEDYIKNRILEIQEVMARNYIRLLVATKIEIKPNNSIWNINLFKSQKDYYENLSKNYKPKSTSCWLYLLKKLGF